MSHVTKKPYYDPDDAKTGEILLGNYTIVQFQTLPYKRKRRGNIARDAQGHMIPRAARLEDTVYPVFVSKSEVATVQ